MPRIDDATWAEQADDPTVAHLVRPQRRTSLCGEGVAQRLPNPPVGSARCGECTIQDLVERGMARLVGPRTGTLATR